MNSLPLQNNSVDLVINDCAINFNNSDQGNKQTVEEIKRVLKLHQSACLLSVAVNRKYDLPKYGKNQELVQKEKIKIPGFFYPLLVESETRRLCWSVPYYKALFDKNSFEYTEFDIEQGKTFFPDESKISYRRYLLALPKK